MEIKQLIKCAIQSLTRHPGRSFLTMLGIIIGISSIIAILAIGKGAEQQIQSQISAMGTNYIGITGSTSAKRSKLRVLQQKSRSKLRLFDATLLKRQIPLINNASPFIAEKGTLSFATKTTEVMIKGGNEDLLSILNRPMKEGIALHKDHIVRNSRVIIVGKAAAEEVGCQTGSIVKINNIPFQVIGITDTLHTYLGTENPNYNVFMPISTLKKYILKKSNSSVHSIIINTKKVHEIPHVISQTKHILRVRHRLQNQEPDDFIIATQQSIAEAAKKTSSTFTLFLFLIGLISLIVGGIGIMNIMLVAVSERQREIGIRIALGATEENVQKQFIIEALVLCGFGGIIGIGLGLFSTWMTTWLLGWPIIITGSSLIYSTLITLSIGLFFGAYPAYHASKMNPVDALAER